MLNFLFKNAILLHKIVSQNLMFLLLLTFKNHQAMFFRDPEFIMSSMVSLGSLFPLCVAIGVRLEKIKAINQLRLSRPLIFDRIFVIIWKMNRTVVRDKATRK